MGLIPVPITLTILLSTIYKFKTENFYKNRIKSIIPLIIISMIIAWCSGTFLYYIHNVLRLKENPKCLVTGANESIIFYNSDCSELNKIFQKIISSKADSIFVYHWSPILYFLLEKKNATSFNAYKPIFNTPEQMQKIINELEKNKPLFVIKDNYIETISDPENPAYYIFPLIDREKLREDPVDEYIKSHYKILQDLKYWKLMKLIQ